MALVMVEKAPLVGSVMVMLCVPSPCAGSARIICPAPPVSGLTLWPHAAPEAGSARCDGAAVCTELRRRRGISVQHMCVIVVVGPAVSAEIRDPDQEVCRAQNLGVQSR